MDFHDSLFRPRMRSRVKGFEPACELKWRIWDGVVADVWDVSVAEGASGEYVSPDPRIFVILDMNPGGHLYLEDGDGNEMVVCDRLGGIFYIPSGFLLRMRSRGLTRLKHLDLHISYSSLTRRFGIDMSEVVLNSAKSRTGDNTLFRLAEALAQECENEGGLHHRYGNGLLDAVVASTLRIQAGRSRTKRGLTRTQLESVTRYIEANCFEAIRLSDLAHRVGLSESHFSHAFKSTTGLPPSRWQMQARVKRIQEKILADNLSLTDAAALAGFSDQAHFTRAFKQIVGLTPAEWRRATRQV